MLKIIIFSLLFLSFVTKLAANNLENNYQFCNKYEFKVFFNKIYDISLCSNKLSNFNYINIYQQDLLLSITYNKSFKKTKLAQSSINEMSRYHQIPAPILDNYYQILLKIFPNIIKGDNLSVIYQNKSLSFYHNQNYLEQINNLEFIIKFLDIWLYPQNKYLKMQQNLLNYYE
jgi:hypothetical protein